EWLHPNCPVYGWYRRVASRSSTRFTSIEYRSTITSSSFRHEYLVVILADGAVCRLDRDEPFFLPDGAPAIDSIRWLPAEGYPHVILDSKLKEPSELIMEVEFPREFDLLDILAI
ncbi:hypothetical protein FRC11_012796, partial [Ceratobasidium sp. 423]